MHPTNHHYRCENCPFFHGWSNSDGVILMNHKGESGQCRRHAPMTTDRSKKWPEVALDDSCGEHPSAPRTKTQNLLALIANRLEPPEDRTRRTMRVPPDAQPIHHPDWMNHQQ